MEERLAEGKAKVRSLVDDIEKDEMEGWLQARRTTPNQKKAMLQALNMDPKLGGRIRSKLERTLREQLRQLKAEKERPKETL